MSLFKPTFALKSIMEITPVFLAEQGISGLLLDVDNTLTTHNNPTPAEGIQEWIERTKAAGVRLIIVSNNSAERVEPFADGLGLRFVPNGAKPLPKGFKQAVAELQTAGLKKSEIAAVGDQIFTDILGANLTGLRSIFVQPMEPETGFWFRVKRALEKPFRPKI